MSNKLEVLETLLFDWESGSLDEQGVERIRELLRNDSDARSHFVQMQMISAAMQLENDAGLAPPLGDNAGAHPLTPSPSHPVTQSPSHPLTPSRSFWAVAALSLLVCGLSIWIIYSQVWDQSDGPLQSAGLVDPNARDASKEATARGIALVTRLVDVTWDADQPPMDVGQALAPGRFAIQAGHAQIDFFCGAALIVEGPAELELQSATRARVHSGRLRAHVPPVARGFSLEVEDLKVVDLGTEFGLSVSSDGASVQVFDGEVELHPAASQKRLLTAGQAVLRTADGSYQDTTITPESFVDIADLVSRARLQRSARYERWKAWSAEVRRDPRLIAYYDFDRQGSWQRRLACSNQPANSELDGAIVGAGVVQGRWGAKSALEFKQPADRVRVQIPGEYGSLTLACWVKIDSLDRWYNSLFLTDGYDQGEPHWQILDNGRIYFSVRPVDLRKTGVRDFKALSPPFWNPSLNGKWIHLAVTCDVDSRTIIHYLNGRMLSRHEVPTAQMPASTRIGTASIGNWSLPTMPDAEFAIRNLNGSMDEFAMFAAALNADEIEEMYEQGKP